MHLIIVKVKFAMRRAIISSRSTLCDKSHTLWSVYWSALELSKIMIVFKYDMIILKYYNTITI